MASFELSFRARTAAALVAFTSITLVAASSFVAGCSSSSDASPPAPAAQVCPVTLYAAFSTPTCTGDPAGQPCVVGFVCPGEINQVASCSCVSGSWACVDSHEIPITDPEAGTTCTNLGPGNDSQCPVSESAASFAGCKTAGLICSYPGATCPGSSTPLTDTCQCNGSADGGLAYECDPQSCIAPPTDAGTFSPDAGDSGH